MVLKLPTDISMDIFHESLVNKLSFSELEYLQLVISGFKKTPIPIEEYHSLELKDFVQQINTFSHQDFRDLGIFLNGFILAFKKQKSNSFNLNNNIVIGSHTVNIVNTSYNDQPFTNVSCDPNILKLMIEKDLITESQVNDYIKVIVDYLYNKDQNNSHSKYGKN